MIQVTKTIFGYDILDPQTGEFLYGHFLTEKDAQSLGAILFKTDSFASRMAALHSQIEAME
jgi:hypothetical protein